MNERDQKSDRKALIVIFTFTCAYEHFFYFGSTQNIQTISGDSFKN